VVPAVVEVGLDISLAVQALLGKATTVVTLIGWSQVTTVASRTTTLAQVEVAQEELVLMQLVQKVAMVVQAYSH
jgi:hypothetical protein